MIKLEYDRAQFMDMYDLPCAGCGRNTENLHHILPRKKFPHLLNERTNLLPLCKKCHYALHLVDDMFTEKHYSDKRKKPNRKMALLARELAETRGISDVNAQLIFDELVKLTKDPNPDFWKSHSYLERALVSVLGLKKDGTHKKVTADYLVAKLGGY